jgi:hypothetical protein
MLAVFWGLTAMGLLSMLYGYELLQRARGRRHAVVMSVLAILLGFFNALWGPAATLWLFP